MYELRVCEVEYASFIPLVMSATGGMAKQATVFYIYRLTHGFRGNTGYTRGWLIIAHEGAIINHRGDISYCRGSHGLTIL